MPEVEGEPTSLLDLIVSLLPDAVEDITYLVDMEGEGLCLHQIQAEEERTTLEEWRNDEDQEGRIRTSRLTVWLALSW